MMLNQFTLKIFTPGGENVFSITVVENDSLGHLQQKVLEATLIENPLLLILRDGKWYYLDQRANITLSELCIGPSASIVVHSPKTFSQLDVVLSDEVRATESALHAEQSIHGQFSPKKTVVQLTTESGITPLTAQLNVIATKSLSEEDEVELMKEEQVQKVPFPSNEELWGIIEKNMPRISENEMREEPRPKLKGHWADMESSKYEWVQRIRRCLLQGYVNDLGNPLDGPTSHESQSLQRLFWESGKGKNVLCWVTVYGVPGSRFMISVFNRDQPVRSMGGLSLMFFGSYHDAIIYPARRTSVKWDWTLTFGKVLDMLGASDADVTPVLILVPSGYDRDKVYQNRNVANTELSDAQRKALMLAFGYWCNDVFKSPPERATLFYLLLHLMCASQVGRREVRIRKYLSEIDSVEENIMYWQRRLEEDPTNISISKKIADLEERLRDLKRYAADREISVGLHTDYGPVGVLDDIMGAIRDYFPSIQPAGQKRGFESSLPCKTNMWVQLGENPGVQLRAGYGAPVAILREGTVAPSDMVDCLNMNGAGAGIMLLMFRDQVRKVLDDARGEARNREEDSSSEE